MSHTVSGQTLTELILEVFRLNGRLLRAGDALARPAGQTSARWQVLGALALGSRTIADVGRRMGLTRQSVQRTADRLEADGLLSYAANPHHERAKLASVTRRGRAALDAIGRRQARWANHVAGLLVEAELRQAIQTIRNVYEALDAPMDSARPASRRVRSSRTRSRTTR